MGAVGRRFGFHCVYCSSRLEATDAMSGQEGQCPTCGSSITIPILDRSGRLRDAVTKQIIKPDPHPVHAYAAAGQRAPRVLRQEDGSQCIRCTKCGRLSAVSANNCSNCGMPFTMEGTADDMLQATNGFAIASFVLGIIGVPFACTLIVPVLAVVFGGIALIQINASPVNNGRWQAIAGISCGLIGLGVALLLYIH